jgi:plastocyanin
MYYCPHSGARGRGPRRLLTILMAICLPVLASTFFSGSFFRIGTLQPGEVLGAGGAHIAHAHSLHSISRESETGTTTPGTGTPGTTGTPGSTATGTPQATATPGGNIVDVSMVRHDGFVPANVTISTGTTVRWTNTDEEQHTTTSDMGLWNSGALNPGQQYQYTFNAPGTYAYSCLIHSGMRGTIAVTGPELTPTPGGTETPQATNTPGTGTVDVSIQNYAFQPQNVTISPGTTVRWTNADSATHTSTSDTGVWNSGTLNQGQSFQYTFNTPGTYTYHCDVHRGMSGTITVTGGGGTTPTATTQSTNTPGATGTPQTTPTGQPTGTAQATGTSQTTTTATATSLPQTVNVSIQSYAYSPNMITIQAGTTVRWTNLDNDRHSVTSAENPPLFDSGQFTQNQWWEYTFNAPGTYTYFCSVHGTFMSGAVIVQATATATPAPGQMFNDVFPGDYFYAAVNWLASRGIISGYADGTFHPYNNTTRGQVTKIVVLSEGWTLANPAQPAFSDVPATHAFYRYVETAVQHGIISGYSDGTFRPGNNVTRGQLAKIVVLGRGWTLLNPTQPTFSDVYSDNAFFRHIETAVQRGIISGYGDATFRPGNNATRGQLSKIIYNALNIAP